MFRLLLGILPFYLGKFTSLQGGEYFFLEPGRVNTQTQLYREYSFSCFACFQEFYVSTWVSSQVLEGDEYFFLEPGAG